MMQTKKGHWFSAHFTYSQAKWTAWDLCSPNSIQFQVCNLFWPHNLKNLQSVFGCIWSDTIQTRVGNHQSHFVMGNLLMKIWVRLEPCPHSSILWKSSSMIVLDLKSPKLHPIHVRDWSWRLWEGFSGDIGPLGEMDHLAQTNAVPSDLSFKGGPKSRLN